MTGTGLVLTLDSGGSGAKVHAFDLERGTGVASASLPYPAPGPDKGLFDPEAWWATALAALASVVASLGAPAGRYLGITVSAIRIPAVLLDGHGELAGPSILNTDRRGEKALGELVARIGADELYARTGHWPTPKLGLAKLLWLRSELPELWRRTATILQLHDWFIYKLCGVMVGDPSSSAMSQMVDVATGGWSDDVLAAAGIRRDRLPPLSPAGTLAGRLDRRVATATGLPHGLPVHVGGGDTHLSVVSACGALLGAPAVVAGTTSPAQVMVDSLPPAADRFPLFASPHALVGRFALESNAGETAGVLARLEGLDDLRTDQLAGELNRRGLLVERSPSVPLAVLSGNPFFSPEGWAVWPPPTVVGLGPAHSGRDVRRAGIEGSCYALRSVLAALDARSGNGSSAVVVTGGMTADPAWNQLLADVCGRDIIVRAPEAIAGLAGAALVTGCDASELVAGIPARRHRPSGESGDHDAGFAGYVESYRDAQRQHAQRASGVVRGAATSIAPATGERRSTAVELLALVSASLRDDAAAALARERCWELRWVQSVRGAVAEMAEEDRRRTVAVVVEAEPVTASLLDELPALELVACLRSDPVNVDVVAASGRSVPVVHTPGRNAEAVADFTLGLCLSSLRGIAESHHGIVSGALTGTGAAPPSVRAAGDVIWRPASPDAPVPYVVYKGRQLSSIVLGIVGFGAVGRAVARRFSGLAREILVADPGVDSDDVADAGCHPVGLDELLAGSDVVSIHARSNSAIVGRHELAAMRRGGYLINTARATVLDYEALADALESGHLRGAALDVFDEEPLPATSRLIGLRGLTLTPHLAGATEEVAGRQSEIFLAAVRGVYDARSSWRRLPVRNPEVRESWLARRRATGEEQPGTGRGTAAAATPGVGATAVTAGAGWAESGGATR